MNPDTFAGAVLANRIFGRLQVRQKMRALCAEYGISPEVLDPPVQAHRPVRLEPMTFLDEVAGRRQWLAEQYVAASVLRPEAVVRIASIA